MVAGAAIRAIKVGREGRSGKLYYGGIIEVKSF